MDYRYETKEEAREFHRQRKAFIIQNGCIEFMPEGTTMSHYEFCQTKGMNQETFNQLTRGFYLNGSLFFYKDNFTYDNILMKEALEHLDDFSKQLKIDEFDIYFGYVLEDNFTPDLYYGKYVKGEVKRAAEKEKYVRVMDGLKSNAGGFEYQLNAVNVAEKWNPTKTEPEEMGGFSFSTEDKILRWLHRGDTIYDVILPNDSDIREIDKEKGIYRANKIIVTNPRKITDKLALELYQKTTLSDIIIAQCLVTLLWKGRLEISKYIVNDRVTLENVDEILKEFIRYAGEETLALESTQTIYRMLQEKKDLNQ